MSQTASINFVTVEETRVRERLAAMLDRGIFGFLLLLIVLTAIPYGTSHPWWKAAFICLVMIGTIAAVVESLLNRAQRIEGLRIVIPIIVLVIFAYLQTIPLPISSPLPAVANGGWRAVSADPYQTRFVALQLFSLACVMLLVYRYVRTKRRVRAVIYVVLGVAVASAIDGMLRQSLQRHTGFFLPVLKPGSGYGQFINKNHFAFLMEMALGVCVGLIAAGVKRQPGMLYLTCLIPIWMALVLSNSRGGLVAMFAQLAIAAMLFGYFRPEWGLFRLARTRAGRLGLILVLFFGLAAGSVWIGGDRLISNLQLVGSEFSPQQISPDGVTRNEIWRATLHTFAAHPILGVGLGGYWVAITEYHDASGTMTPQEAHSDYLELLASGGIVGFGIAVWFALIVGKRIHANLRTTSNYFNAVSLGAVLGIVGVALHSLFDFGLHMLANALVFVVLVSLATSTVEAKATEEID